MASKKRLFEIFKHVTGIRIEESGLEYAHVDNAEPTQDSYTIGEEINEDKKKIEGETTPDPVIDSDVA